MNIVFGTIIKVIAGFYVGCTGVVLEDNGGFGTRPGEFIRAGLQCKTTDGMRFPDQLISLKATQVEVIEQPKRDGVK